MAENETKTEDGVNREGLDYRAGYVEALGAMLRILNMAALRATKKTEPGIREAFDAAKNLREQMVAKMKGQ